MKNIIDEKPSNVYGRLLFSSNFVHDSDIEAKKVLDIGSGYGWFEINAVSKNVKSIIGIDMTNEDISTALKYVNYDNVSFRVGSAIELPFEDSVFDTVVSWEVLEHIPKFTENKMRKKCVNLLIKLAFQLKILH